MYRNNLYSGVALATLMALCAAPAFAQQQTTAGQDVQLDTINVDGTKAKGAQRGNDEPATATEEQTVLTERSDRAKLDQRSVSDPKDIGRLAPGVSYSETTRGFNVRGLDRQRVATTIDGIPLPYLDDGARGAGSPGATGGPGSVDFDSLSAIDVVKGSDSSVFGSGMLGGGVRFRTLEPEDLIEEGEKFGGITKFAFDERDQSYRAEQALAGRVGNTFVLVQGGYRDGEEISNKGDYAGPPPNFYGTSRTIKNESDYDTQNLLVKLRHYTDTGHMIGFTGERFSRDEDITPLNLSPTTYDLSTVNTNETNKRDRVSFDYRYDGGGLLDLAEAKVFWQRQDLHDNFTASRISIPIGPYRRDNSREYDIFGVNGSALKSIETENTQHNVTFGGQVYGSKSHQYSLGVDNCPPGQQPPGPFVGCNFLHSNQSDMPDTDGVTVAAFVQNEIELFDNSVRVTPGVRFDYYSYKPELTPEYAESPAFSNNGLPDENSDSAFSPKLRFEVDATENVTLFAQWAQAFRAPSVNELYLTYGGPSTYLRIGDDELKPETSNGFDVGVLTGDDRSGGSAKVFYNKYENYIDDVALGTPNGLGGFNYTAGEIAYLASLGYDPANFPAGITQSINRANVAIYGAEFEAHHKLDNGLYGWGQLGAYIGQDTDLDVGLNTIPAAKLMIGLGYERETWGAEAIFTAVASRSFTDNPLVAGSQPDRGSDLENAVSATENYELVDFTAWWSPKQLEGLTLRAGIYNIFDQSYFEDGLDLTSTTNRQYFTQPGRNVRVSGTYKF
jgi:hemoglobin/transferrin/lactoferrin receptor protein